MRKYKNKKLATRGHAPTINRQRNHVSVELRDQLKFHASRLRTEHELGPRLFYDAKAEPRRNPLHWLVIAKPHGMQTPTLAPRRKVTPAGIQTGTPWRVPLNRKCDAAGCLANRQGLQQPPQEQHRKMTHSQNPSQGGTNQNPPGFARPTNSLTLPDQALPTRPKWYPEHESTPPPPPPPPKKKNSSKESLRGKDHMNVTTEPRHLTEWNTQKELNRTKHSPTPSGTDVAPLTKERVTPILAKIFIGDTLHAWTRTVFLHDCRRLRRKPSPRPSMQ